jgi:ParB family transcriptional regulator, chromosome partitioning protein
MRRGAGGCRKKARCFGTGFVSKTCRRLSIYSATVPPTASRPSVRTPFDRLAAAAGLDMAQWWEPTAANYLGRISKAQIVDAVTEGAGAQAASKLDGLKKGDMAARAEEWLSGKGWTPAIFR